jgi:hypothetical protein
MILQIIIVFLSASAIFMISRKENWSKWGYLVGLIGQPFWLYSTYHSEQWGIFLLSMFYIYSWGTGVYNYCLNDIKNAFKKSIQLMGR